MQHINDILTQLVTRTTSETDTNESPIITETNDTASSPTRNNPIIQTPPSPPLAQNAAPTSNNNDDEDENESNVSLR